MATFPTYATTDGYAALIAELEGVKNSQTTLFSNGNYTALPTGAIVWSTANARFEKWSGSAFVELVARYNISVKYLNGQLLSKSATGDTVVQRTTAGQIKAADPSAGDEAVIKSWGDARYRNASNLNQGTIPQARFPETIDTDISGDAATLDGHSVQSSDMDTTDGALMTVGAFGLGGSVQLPSGTDLDTVVDSGFYRLNSGPVHAPVGANYSQMIVSRGEDTITQIIGQYSTGNLFTRSGNPPEVGGSRSYSPWGRLWSDTNDGKTSALIAEEAARADSASSANYATNAGYANNSNLLDGRSSGYFAVDGQNVSWVGGRYVMGDGEFPSGYFGTGGSITKGQADDNQSITWYARRAHI